MVLKLIEVLFAFLLGFFTVILVGVYHFIKIFWIYILTAMVFTSLFHSGIHNMPIMTSCNLGIGMTVLMVVALNVFSKK